MSRLTDQTLGEACANGDGTYNGLTLMRWLFEAVSGKPMGEDEARKALDEVAAKRANVP